MSNANGTIFINYRKDDSNWNALALYNDLQKYFSKEQLFKDFNAIRPGDDFVVSIDNALAKCTILLVIIGRDWLDIKGRDGTRRLDDPDDFVRLEVATALERGIQVIPVLFDDTPMPRPEELPENLRPLYRRQFVEIDPKRFDDDVRNLAEAIKKMLPPDPNPIPTPPRPTPPNPAPQPKPVNPPQAHLVKPDNNLVWAIISTVICCIPLGIVAIIHANKVDTLYANGQYVQAKQEADKAKQWSIYAAITGAVVIVIYLMLVGTIGENSGY